jgi:hypothetical protein
MNLRFPKLEAASPARQFTANWEPTLNEILEEPIIRQLMARDGVTEPTLRRLANEIGESLIATRVDRAEVPFYSDDLLPQLQRTLALLADIEIHFEIERDYLESWSGSSAVRDHLLTALEQCRRASREQLEVCLSGIRLRAKGSEPAIPKRAVTDERP